MTALLDHLWQSTLFAVAAGLVALLLRRHAARVRFWLWFAASVKFLLPFSVLVALGEWLSRLSPAPAPAAPSLLAMRPAAAPFSTPDMLPGVLPGPLPVEQGINLVLAGLAVWGLGFSILLAVRLRHWLRLRRLLAAASDMGLNTPVTVVSSDSQQEPGLVGIWKPVIAGMFREISLQTVSCRWRPSPISAISQPIQRGSMRRCSCLKSIPILQARISMSPPRLEMPIV